MASLYQQPRKGLMIKLPFPHGSQKRGSFTIDDSQRDNKRRRVEQSSTKPTISCYRLDAKDSTITLSQQNNKMIENQLSSTTTVSTAKGNQNPKSTLSKENSKVCAKDSKGTLKNDGNAELIKKEEHKKPMEHYKKMQCWVILKKMIEGRDGWALKHPLDLKVLEGLSKSNCLENKYELKANMGLKDIEAKLGFYSTPDEFADDVRLVFSHGLLYTWKDDVHKTAKRLHDTFENRWESLKKEWTLEERRVKKINKRKRESLCSKSDRGQDQTSSKILKEKSNVFATLEERSIKIR
ncbi:bromodomain protein, putative [Medicago truncatula]|uniref:Bromodomain protein, putative n=1 Tax=Medicago truncatula TaxID=3880 RepID=G7LGF4_MEDTR|nr:bromodomain protein, putative [Medicago truncatula]